MTEEKGIQVRIKVKHNFNNSMIEEEGGAEYKVIHNFDNDTIEEEGKNIK